MALGLSREPLRDEEVLGQLEAVVCLGSLPQCLTGAVDIVLQTRRGADRVALCGKEREAHRAADEHRIGHVQEMLDESDLVCHLRAAEHRHQRPSGPLEDSAQCANLALHQASGGTRQQVGDFLGAGVGPVGGAERVVDVDVSQVGERPGELGIVLCLPGLVAHVLEHEDLPFRQLFSEESRPPRRSPLQPASRVLPSAL